MKLKKATSYEEQVKLLADKNIIIKDKQQCISFLSKTNYDRLSGYFLPFISKETEKFFFPTDFERICSIYYFDSELRN